MDLIRRNLEWTLRNLHAETFESTSLATPSVEGVYALRSIAYCKTAGLEIWAQYSFYVVGSRALGEGRLIQQCLFAESTRRAELEEDFVQFSDAMHNAFMTAVNGGQF